VNRVALLRVMQDGILPPVGNRRKGGLATRSRLAACIPCRMKPDVPKT